MSVSGIIFFLQPPFDGRLIFRITVQMIRPEQALRQQSQVAERLERLSRHRAECEDDVDTVRPDQPCYEASTSYTRTFSLSPDSPSIRQAIRHLPQLLPLALDAT